MFSEPLNSHSTICTLCTAVLISFSLTYTSPVWIKIKFASQLLVCSLNWVPCYYDTTVFMLRIDIPWITCILWSAEGGSLRKVGGMKLRRSLDTVVTEASSADYSRRILISCRLSCWRLVAWLRNPLHKAVTFDIIKLPRYGNFQIRDVKQMKIAVLLYQRSTCKHMVDCNITPRICNLGIRSGEWLVSRYVRLNISVTAPSNCWIDESGGHRFGVVS